MNTTQRKYAMERLTTITRQRWMAIVDADNAYSQEYKKLSVFNAQDLDLMELQDVEVTMGSSISTALDLSAIKERIEQAEVDFQKDNVRKEIHIRLPWDENWRTSTLYWQKTQERGQRLLEQLQSAKDKIMLGDATAATEAIEIFEKQSF